MSHLKALSLVFSGIILCTAAMAADSPTQPNPPPRPQAARPGIHGCMMGLVNLSPEARIIHMQDMRKQADTLTVTKFREARKAECDKIAAMNPDARQKYAADLEARWKALPDSEKLKAYHEALEHRPHMGPGPGRDHMPMHRMDDKHHGPARDAR